MGELEGWRRASFIAYYGTDDLKASSRNAYVGGFWAGRNVWILPQPVMMKTNYKYTMLYPIPQTKKIAGKCCQPFGRSTALWGSGREFPFTGEDFVYQIFRKRDCCAGNLLDYFGGG